MTTVPYFLYSTVNDFSVNDRKARMVQTRKKLLEGGKKIACLKYIPKKGNHQWRRVIADPSGKPIYYLSIGRLGDKDSLDGEAYRICKPEKKDRPFGPNKVYKAWCKPRFSYILAVKVIPLTVEEANDMYNPIYRTWKEIKILKEVTDLFNKGVSQNLPIYYTDTICTDSKLEDYQNENIISYFGNGARVAKMAELIKEIGAIKEQLTGIKHYKDVKKKIDSIYSRVLKEFLSRDTKQYSTKSVLIFNEISDFDFTHLLENYPDFVLRKEYILPTIFQILHGIAAIQEHLGIVHFDLHLSNVLVTKIVPDGYWHYRIDKIDYYIPNQGFLFKIWDFGRSSYLNTDSPESIKKKISKQFNRFFKFDVASFNKKLNVTFRKSAFRRYLYSFDVYRFFSAYHAKLIQSIGKMSQTTVSTSALTSSQSDPLNTLTPRRINQLPEIEILKKINDYAFEDIMYHLVSPRIKKHTYPGGPKMIIKKFFETYTVPPKNKKDIINSDPFVV